MSTTRPAEIQQAECQVPTSIRFVFWSGVLVTCATALGLLLTPPAGMVPQQQVWLVVLLGAWLVLLWYVYRLRPWARNLLILWLLMGVPIELASIASPWADDSWLNAINLPIDLCYVIILLHPRVRSAYTQVPRPRWKVLVGVLVLTIGMLGGIGTLITRQLIDPATGSMRMSDSGWLQRMWDPQRSHAAALLGVELDHSVLPMVVRQNEDISLVRLWEPPRQWWFVLTDTDQVLTPSTVQHLLVTQGGFSARTLDARWRQLDYQSQEIAGISVEQGVLEEDGVALVLGWRRGIHRHIVYCMVGMGDGQISTALETPWFQQLLQTDIPRELVESVGAELTLGVAGEHVD